MTQTSDQRVLDLECDVREIAWALMHYPNVEKLSSKMRAIAARLAEPRGEDAPTTVDPAAVEIAKRLSTTQQLRAFGNWLNGNKADCANVMEDMAAYVRRKAGEVA